MAKFTNSGEGLRGIVLKAGDAGGDTVWVEPGQTVDLEEKDVHHAHVDFEKGDAAAKKAAQAAEEAEKPAT